MKSGAALVVTAAVLTVAAGAVRAETLNVKLGTWETTTVTNVAGMHLPEAQLQKLPPEQRQRIEAAMKKRGADGPKTHTSRSCLTKEKLDRGFDEHDGEGCKRTYRVATATKQDVVIECTGQNAHKGEMRFEALSREHVKGSMKMASEAGNVTADFDSKWISAACEEKP